jgi:hypothetical protein
VIPTRGARKSRVHGVNTCTIACWFLHSTRKVRGKAHHPPDERAKTTDSRLLVLRPDLAVPDPPVGLEDRARAGRGSCGSHTQRIRDTALTANPFKELALRIYLLPR